MRIAIVGAGAMGGFYGAKLALAGYDVHFLMRRDYNTVKHKGLVLESRGVDFHLPEVNCYQDVKEIGDVDLVFIGLKTTSNNCYEELVGPLMGSKTLALTAQNGLGNEERLAELFGAERIAGGLSFLCANRLEPGVICHLDYGQIHIGNYLRGPDEKLNNFAAMLVDSGIDCKVVDDLATARWKKLIWNVPFSGLSALLDKTVDKIVTDNKLRGLAKQLMREIQTAAAAWQLNIDDDFLYLMMSNTDKMTPYYTSMHLDRRNHQPMEIESIIGEPLRRGRGKNVDMPETEKLYEGLTALDRDNHK